MAIVNLASLKTSNANATINSIPQTGKHLILTVSGYGGNSGMNFTWNGITTTTYTNGHVGIRSDSSTTLDYSSKNNNTFIAPTVYSYSQPSNMYRAIIFNYSMPSRKKSALVEMVTNSGTYMWGRMSHHIETSSTAAITSINVLSAAATECMISLEMIV